MKNVTHEFVDSVFSDKEAEKKSEKAIKALGLDKDEVEAFLSYHSYGKEEEETLPSVRLLGTRSALTYSDSPLVDYTCLSPNCNSPRGRSIDTITIHEVWGELSMKALGDIFLPESRQASSNYGVCTDGIALFVHERDRAWTSGSSQDYRAVTIEVSNSREYPNAVDDDVYKMLIELCADICKRNGKTKMIWCGSLAKTNERTFKADEMRMTLHKWFQATDCPGQWLSDHMQDIADKVTAILTDGWVKMDGKWYYYKNGKMQTGWQKVNGYWYYMNKKGVMQTGWQKINGYWYYLREGNSGRMLTGWQKINGKWYYLREGDSGRMLTGWQKINGKWYYFATGGAMITGWKKIKGYWYYMDPISGIMQTGTVTIDGKSYTFDDKGHWIKK